MKKVLVTGVSGFAGLHCAAELLKQGYAVRGSVRDVTKTASITKTIEKVIDPKGNLEYVELNLSSDEGWDQAMEGIDFVLHIASPYVVSEPKDENEVIKPAVDGTLRALKAAKKAGVKRVVLTSSLLAMIGDANKSLDLDYKSWTNVENKNLSAYIKSKTLAERKAWEFINAQQGADKLELVVIIPGPIYGPTLSDKLSGESMHMFKDIITGKIPMFPKINMNISDVRDIATVHVKAMGNKNANGKRFVVASEGPHSFVDMTRIMKRNGYKKVATREIPTFLVRFMARFVNDLKGVVPAAGYVYNANINDTMKMFNWKPIPFEKMVLDTAKCVKERLDK